jgi:nucleotide-binding universal stress UspA family protein
VTATIVVGYDDSDGATAALDAAARLAGPLGARIVAVFCYEPPAVLAGGAAGEQRNQIEEMGRAWLGRAMQRLEGSGLEFEGELVDARPVEGLVAAGDEHDALFIVVGHHGEGPLRGAILGATSSKLLHVAERPVLVVPAAEAD